MKPQLISARYGVISEAIKNYAVAQGDKFNRPVDTDKLRPSMVALCVQGACRLIGMEWRRNKAS